MAKKKASSSRRANPEERGVRMYVEQRRMKHNAEIEAFYEAIRSVTINDAPFIEKLPIVKMAI